MLQSRRAEHTEALLTGDTNPSAGVLLRRKVPTRTKGSWNDLFADSLREDIKEKLRVIFREALMAPNDAMWLASALEPLLGKVAKATGHAPKMATEGDDLILEAQHATLRLTWSGIWHLRGVRCGLDELTGQMLRAFFGR